MARDRAFCSTLQEIQLEGADPKRSLTTFGGPTQERAAMRSRNPNEFAHGFPFVVADARFHRVTAPA